MTTWHVATTGKDSAAGTEAAPLKTIKAGVAKLKPGDVVLVAPGIYAEAVSLDRSGSAVAGVTLRSAVKGGALIRPPASAWNGITISGNYVTVEGFEISDAPGDGIEGNGVHHATVRDCAIHGCGESGIQFNFSEWLTITGNECFGNALKGWFSGISVYENRALTADASDGFRVVIRDNICHDNVTPPAANGHTDGNGILIDDFQNGQVTGFPNYTRPTLVENNLCYRNGGKGVCAFVSDNVTIRRNTCWGNNRDTVNEGTWRGDIAISQSRGARVEGNVAVCTRGSGRLTENRAYDDTSYAGSNSTTFVGNVGWDPAGTPSIRLDGNAPSNFDPLLLKGIRWVDPKLVDNIPTAAGMADVGWRPTGVDPTPIPEPEPPAPPVQLPQVSVYGSQTPAQIVTSDAVAYELGTRLTVSRAGRITGLRLYRTNAAAQPIRLWRDGVVVASGTIPGGSGWAEAAVDMPVAAGDVLVVSVGKAAAQSYACTPGGTPAEADGYAITAGLYAEGINRLPVTSYAASYYWTDVRLVAAAVEPEPEEPEDMEAVIAALMEFDRQTAEKQAAQDLRLAALESRAGGDPALIERIAALEAEVEALKTFDQKVKDL